MEQFLSSVGITEPKEIICNPSYKQLFEDEMQPGLEGYARGYLTELGASRIVGRDELLDDPGKPMESAVWGGCVDCVGGQVLARVIKQMKYGAGIASLGNAAGGTMHASIIPFLLRSVDILGIDSVSVPVARRAEIWAALAAEMPRDVLAAMTEEIGLSEVPDFGSKILEGQVRGRILVDVNR